MKPASAALRALLASRQFFAADLYTFVLPNGVTLRYCASLLDIVANGLYYPCGGQTGPYFDRRDNKAKILSTTTTQTNQLVVDCIPGSALVEGAPFLQACQEGLFDAAEVTLERAYMPTYGITTPWYDNAGHTGYGDTRAGVVRTFVGRVGALDFGRSICTFTINSHTELMNLMFPRNLFQVPCVNNLYDGSCLAVKSSFETTGSIASSPASTIAVLYLTISGTYPTGTFNAGSLTFSSGANNGLSIDIDMLTFGSPNVAVLTGELPVAPSNGDTFTLYYGCDKSSGQPLIRGGTATGSSSTLTAFVTVAGIAIGQSVACTTPGILALGTKVTGIGSTTCNITPAALLSGSSLLFNFTDSNGCAKFNNLVHFRGFPTVPQPVTAI